MSPPLLLLALLQAIPSDNRVRVTADDVEVTSSCTLVFEAPIEDAGRPGVVRITADGVTVACEGVLRGAAPDALPNAYTGLGIVVNAKDVVLTGARVSGFRVGIHAAEADGLVLSGADVSDNFRQRLRSTPAREDASDWLWPHDNDEHQWFERYGAGVYVERSRRVTVRDCRARDTQNGLVLDRVEESLVYDNDFSFLSGWGVALWRSSRNVLSRNALDFCVRGYSHGIYNRGQDSAGILLFEQCSGNAIVENSATHGGDGLFAFAGQEALGERGGLPAGFDHGGRGNNDNLIVRNDFSYAAAHGLELTFSFGNQIFGNRLVENAICGIWGGYSRDTLITQNLFAGNGDGAYGLERGGINIEHGQRNVILRNRFEGNRCGVHLWWDADPGLAALPWTRVNGFGSGDNLLIGNEFERDDLAIQLRAAGPTTLAGNRVTDCGAELEADDASPVLRMEEPDIDWVEPELPVLGDTQPIGARERLVGRGRIVVTEWGPYDWARPYLWLRNAEPARHGYRVLEGRLEGYRVSDGLLAETRGDALELSLLEPGVRAYELGVTIDGKEHIATGTLVRADWSVRFFPFTTDPREDVEAWRAEGADAPLQALDALELAFGSDGPARFVEGLDVGPDRFGTLAETTLTFAPGSWTLRVRSDDGVRLWLDDELLIDDWTHHATTVHEATLRADEPRTATLRLEHFELDGAAELGLEIVATRP